jgi:hypothetical protein
MNISLAAITVNRLFTKALARNATLTKCLESVCSAASTRDDLFDILQVVFVDAPAATVRLVGTKSGDRLYQVNVGLPEGLSFRPADDIAFVTAVANQVLRAIEKAPLSPEKRKAGSAGIDECRRHAVTAAMERLGVVH